MVIKTKVLSSSHTLSQNNKKVNPSRFRVPDQTQGEPLTFHYFLLGVPSLGVPSPSPTRVGTKNGGVSV